MSISSSALSTLAGAPQNVTGLASGVDTNAIVSALMAVEAKPKVRLQQQQSVERVRQQALADVQTRLTTLQTSINALRDVGTWSDSQTVDSSDPTKVTATRTAGAAAGAFQLEITDLARADQYKSATLTGVTNAGRLTVGVGASSVSVDVVAGASLDTIAAQVNGATGTTVYASVVNSQLVFSGRTTGAAATIAISGDAALTAELGFTHSISSSDAHFKLDGVSKSSSSNLVTNALPGIQLVLKGATGTPVSVAVGAPTPDTASIQAKIQGFVDQYNSTLDFISTKLSEQRVAIPQSDADRAKGVLNGDPALTSLLSSLRTSVSDLFGGRPSTAQTLAQIGLSTGAAVGTGTINQSALAGKLTLDATKLATSLTTSLGDVKALFTNPTHAYTTEGLAQRLGDLVGAQVGSGGQLAGRISSSATAIVGLTKDIADWDVRLATKQKALLAQFTAMETALSQAQSQGNSISAQISKL